MSIPAGSRYVPIKDTSVGGIIMLRNRTTDAEEIIELVAAGGPKLEEEAEPEPPEPFEYTEDWDFERWKRAGTGLSANFRLLCVVLSDIIVESPVHLRSTMHTEKSGVVGYSCDIKKLCRCSHLDPHNIVNSTTEMFHLHRLIQRALQEFFFTRGYFSTKGW